MAPSVVQYDVASGRNSAACTDAIQMSYTRFTSTGFRRDKCVTPGSRLIAAHRCTKRMVYANKNGLIRVLEPTGAANNSIIDHHKTDTVHDITYCPVSGFDDSVGKEASALFRQIWASVATKKVVLWMDTAILVEILMPPKIEPTKLVWNYGNSNLVWILCNNGTAIFLDVQYNLPSLSHHPVHQYAISKIPDQLQGLTKIQDGVIDMGWSPFAPLLNTIATIHENGNLCLWDSPGGGQGLKLLRQVKTTTGQQLTRCAVVGPDTILVASDNNRTLALYQGQDLAHIATLLVTGTKDSFVLETLFPDQATCRIVLTSRDQGLALIVGLSLTSQQPFATISPFHSTMAGYSFHCSVVPAIEMDMEDPNVRNVKLTLYGPQEVQTWILEETKLGTIQPDPVVSVSSVATPSSSCVDRMTFEFADYTIEEDDDTDELVDRDETTAPGLISNTTNGPPGLEKTTVSNNSNPFVNWLGAISSPRPAAVSETPPLSMSKFVATTPTAPAAVSKLASPPPQPQPSFVYTPPPQATSATSMASPPSARQQQNMPSISNTSAPQGGTALSSASRNVVLPSAATAAAPVPSALSSTPAATPPRRDNLSSEVVPPPLPAATSILDIKVLHESLRSIIKEEVVKSTSEISAQLARTILIPAIDSITQQIMQKVSDHVNQQQTQSSRQLEVMSEQLTQVTSLISVLTREVQSLQAQQQQHGQGTIAPMDEAAILEQNAAKARQEVDYLLSQNDVVGALRHALAAPKTDLVYYCCEATDLTALLEAQPQLFTYQDLLQLIHRLSNHMMDNTDGAQVDAIAVWVQGICIAAGDSTVAQTRNIAPADVRTVMEHALAACGQAQVQANNRRSVQMAVYCLKNLTR